MPDHTSIWMLDLQTVESRTFMPDDALAEHKKDLDFIRSASATFHIGLTMVVTHRLPSPHSLSSRFANDALSPPFASRLDLLPEEIQPGHWIHGHDPHRRDYHMGRMRVVAKPNGYGPSQTMPELENQLFEPVLVIAIGYGSRCLPANLNPVTDGQLGRGRG